MAPVQNGSNGFRGEPPILLGIEGFVGVPDVEQMVDRLAQQHQIEPLRPRIVVLHQPGDRSHPGCRRPGQDAGQTGATAIDEGQVAVGVDDAVQGRLALLGLPGEF